VGSALAVAVGLAVAVAVALAVAVAVAVALGLAVALAVAVGLAVALAVAMGLALMPLSPYVCAKAAEASSTTSAALTPNTSKTFFIKHLL
jgi:hypothetical protein